MTEHHTEISIASPGPYAAAHSGVAMLQRVDRGCLVVTGADRAAFLHALLTNDIATLAPGTGCYAALLTPQGRLVTDLWIHELGDSLLIRVDAGSRMTLLTKLDSLVFSEDVQLGDVSESFTAVSVVGPASFAAVAGALEGTDLPAELALHGVRRAEFAGSTAVVVRADDLGVPGYEVLVDADRSGALLDALRARGAADLDPSTAEVLRIEHGMPRFRRDMDEETIPLEAGIEGRAISQTKGCYIGQEVIVRVLHRGHGRVARRLMGLICDRSDAPLPGAPVFENGQHIGQVTSSAVSPSVGRAIALAYLQRESAEPGRRVAVGQPGESGEAAGPTVSPSIGATVAALPFLPSAV